jgi:hypothetical protein
LTGVYVDTVDTKISVFRQFVDFKPKQGIMW